MKHAKKIFTILFLIALSPVLIYRYFPTVDGPAHLYNAAIIREMIFGSSEFYSRFFEFNSAIVPNWTGHLIAVLSGFILPLWMTEKLIVLLIICLLPVSVMYVAKAFRMEFSLRYLLLLPFMYPLTLYIGFFNFMLGLPMMFFTLAWMKKFSEQSTISSFLMLSLFVTLVYFSHILVFGIMVIMILVWMIFHWIMEDFNSRWIWKYMFALVSFVPGIILGILFYSGRDISGFRNRVDSLSFAELMDMILEGAAFVGLNQEREVPATSIFMMGILLLLIFIFAWRIFGKRRIVESDFWLVAAMIVMTFYFFVPNDIASGGFISVRFLLVGMLFVTVWIISQPLPKIITIAAAILGVGVSWYTLPYRLETAKTLNSDVKSMIKVSEQVEEYSVILPLNYSENWLHINLSNYLGANRKVIVLDNYEAVLNEFPLLWRKKYKPELKAGNFTQSGNPFIYPERYESETGQPIQYVSRWQFREDPGDSVKTATALKLKLMYPNSIKAGEAELFFK